MLQCFDFINCASVGAELGKGKAGIWTKSVKTEEDDRQTATGCGGSAGKIGRNRVP